MIRDYQSECIDGLREIIFMHRSACLQLATGGGKTAIIAEITHIAFTREFRVWFVIPRNELLNQASAHFTKWKIAHGLIAAGVEESRAFKIHVVSKDTLLRRLNRIKKWPDLLVFDECHLYWEAQLLIISHLPKETKIIGVSATPERLSGEGLASSAGGPYDDIYYGPSIPWLTDRGFLAPLRYFAPPIEGLESIHRKGTEYDADELDALLEKRKVYGDVVNYYRKYGKRDDGKNKPALIFTRSVKSAYDVADRFRQAGFSFECIEGTRPKNENSVLIQALRERKLDGLVCCDLAIYGVDIPSIEYAASLRPTLSRALYFQMVGRVLRPCDGKTDAMFFDHANLVREHFDPSSPGTPLFYLDGLTWNFHGREKREKAKQESAIKLCPLRDYTYCADPACRLGCKLDPSAAVGRAELETVDATLTERTPARGWTDLEPSERRDVQDRIGRATDAWLAALAEDPPRIDAGPVGALLAIAAELGREPMWVFWHLTEREGPRRSVNVTLLHEIARAKGYKPGWAWFKRKQIEDGIKEDAKELVG